MSWPHSLGEYICDGPLSVYRADLKHSHGLVLEFSLGRVEWGVDPQEALAIYVPDSSMPWSVHRQRPVIRRVVWNRYSDLRRRLKEDLPWPDIHVEFYRLSRDDYVAIDAGLRRLDEALRHLPLLNEGFVFPIARDAGPRHEPAFNPADINTSQSRSLKRGNGGFHIDISFMGWFGIPPDDLTAGWEELWLTLEGLCIRSRAVECEEYYSGLSLQAYAAALRSQAKGAL